MVDQFVFLKQDLGRYVPRDRKWALRTSLRLLMQQRIYALFIYRFGRWVYYEARGGVLLLPLKICYILANKLFVELLLGMFIPANCTIGPGLYINNFLGLVINPNVIIGDNCSIGHGVIIGTAADGTARAPVIGNNVYIGSRAIVIGPITVGDNVRIGANAVVNRDVPADVTVAGVPAKIVREHGN